MYLDGSFVTGKNTQRAKSQDHNTHDFVVVGKDGEKQGQVFGDRQSSHCQGAGSEKNITPHIGAGDQLGGDQGVDRVVAAVQLKDVGEHGQGNGLQNTQEHCQEEGDHDAPPGKGDPYSQQGKDTRTNNRDQVK